MHITYSIDTDMYLGNRQNYIQVHLQNQYTAIFLDAYVPITEPQLKLCTQMGIVHYRENAHAKTMDIGLCTGEQAISIGMAYIHRVISRM